MARARADTLRALLARCSTKCPAAAAAPAPTTVPRLVRLYPHVAGPTATSFSRFRPVAMAAAATRFLTSKAPGGISEDGEELQEWTVELEEEEEGKGAGLWEEEEEGKEAGLREEEEGKEAELWEEEEDDEAEPEVGDGGAGGGVILRDVEWGERALAAANEVLGERFGDDVAMFAFKVSPKGYVYVRLDKLTHKYGCPEIEEIESFHRLYKQKLDEIIEGGEIPLELGIQVSSPGAQRLLKVPEDLDRFKDMAMRVQYVEDTDLGSKQGQVKDGVFLLELIDRDTEHCIWKLANVRENRDEAGKGRPLSRKQKDWRLQTPFTTVKRVTLYLHSSH